MTDHVSARSLLASSFCWVLAATAVLASGVHASEAQRDELARDARSPYADKRRRAIAKLAARGDLEAFEIVFHALGDDDSEVADEAQLRLPEFEGRLVWNDVAGREGLRSRDDGVRERVAEALGRWRTPVEARDLVRALDPRDPRRTRLLLWSLERLARRDLLEGAGERAVLTGVRRCLSARANDRLRAAALSAYAALQPGAARAEVAEILDEDLSRQTLCAALSVLVETAPNDGSDSCALALESALGHTDAAVRAHAARLIAHTGGPYRARRSTLLRLVDRLDCEPRPVCRDHVLRTLRRITGMRFGPRTESWVDWASDRPEHWRPAPAPAPRAGSAEAGAREDGAGRTRSAPASLDALDPASDRLAVLVDFSGSLWNERGDGTRKKDVLDPQVTGLLDRLDEDAVFFLVPYTAECHPHTDEPVRATRRCVASAKSFFERATMRGRGDLWGAARLALEQDAIDRILVVTDGAPTGGMHWNAELIVDLLLESTRFRPVVFDFVLEGAPARLERAWRRLADATGGRVLVVEDT